MAIIDRDAISVEALEAQVALEQQAGRSSSSAGRFPLSGSARVLLAALSVAAGVIHLVMVPSHAGEWLPEGLAFAAAGWFQLGLAVLLLTRPSRLALRVGCLVNALFIGAWTWSRIGGLPFGPDAGAPHAASFVDITCVAFEVAFVVFGYELLSRPDLGARLSERAKIALTLVPVGILVLASAAIVSPSAAGHAHAGGDAESAAGHDDGTATGGHDHGGAADTPVDDKGLSLIMNGKGEGGGHTHTDEVVPVDAATQQELDAQLDQTKSFIEQYPTVRDAEAAGYHRQGPYSPGLGAHYAAAGSAVPTSSLTMTGEALKRPMLIYDGVAPESKLAGFMYMILSFDTANPPEGFAGPNDHWHFHTDVCIKARADGGVDAPLGADASATKALCDTYQGVLVANTGYMVHVWTVPGYESPQGLFSNLNAKLTCPNGTYYIVPQEEIGTRANVCKDVPA